MKVVELFAGVGGFRIGLERAGHEIIWSNEWDKYACQTYDKNFGGEIDRNDITTIAADAIPSHDIICGGFPCQAFSIAGKRRGFDETRGTLFFEILRIAKHHKTKYLFLENVKGLLNHDGGRTFATIITALDELGYDCQWQVLNSKDFGVPQNRERVFIIANLRSKPRPQIFPFDLSSSEVEEIWAKNHNAGGYSGDSESTERGTTKRRTIFGAIAHALRSTDGGPSSRDTLIEAPMIIGKNGKRKATQDLAATLTGGAHSGGNHSDMDLLVTRTPLKFLERNQKKIEGDYSFTVDTHNTGGVKVQNQIRRLTPIECERLQGFPDNWTAGVSDTQRYKQMGNAVTVNVIEAIARRLCTT